MKKIKVALTGMGGYGIYYVNLLTSETLAEYIDFVGIIDPYAEKSREYERVKEKKIPIYENMEDFYQKHSADLMIISTPIHLHMSHTCCALMHGSHVLCEKPTTATVAQLEKVMETEAATGKKVFVGFQLSHDSSILALKADILSGRYGKPLRIKSQMLWERDLQYYARNAWAGRIKDDHGNHVYDSVASNALAHYLHNELFLLGKTMDTAASFLSLEALCCKANRIESFDTCTLRGSLDCGAELLYIASHAIKGHKSLFFELELEKATALYDSESAVHILVKNNNEVIETYHSDKQEHLKNEKTARVIQWIMNPENFPLPPCQAKTTMPFLQTMNALFDHCKMQTFPKESILTDEVAQRLYVKDLFEQLGECYKQNALLNECFPQYGFEAQKIAELNCPVAFGKVL